MKQSLRQPNYVESMRLTAVADLPGARLRYSKSSLRGGKREKGEVEWAINSTFAQTMGASQAGSQRHSREQYKARDRDPSIGNDDSTHN